MMMEHDFNASYRGNSYANVFHLRRGMKVRVVAGGRKSCWTRFRGSQAPFTITWVSKEDPRCVLVKLAELPDGGFYAARFVPWKCAMGEEPVDCVEKDTSGASRRA